MTQEFERACNALLLEVPPSIAEHVRKIGREAIRSAERAARAQERERCAKIADEHYQGHANWGDDGARVTAGIIAAAIRALPEETTDAT